MPPPVEVAVLDMKKVLIMDTVLPVSAHNPPPKPSVVLLMNCVPLMVVGPLKTPPLPHHQRGY